MDFGIGMEIDKEASKSSYYVHSFVDRLSEFIRTRYYGSGIEHFTIGLVVIRSSPGYEDWFKQRKPRFRKVQKTPNARPHLWVQAIQASSQPLPRTPWLLAHSESTQLPPSVAGPPYLPMDRRELRPYSLARHPENGRLLSSIWQITACPKTAC